jgi:hypothetical protein
MTTPNIVSGAATTVAELGKDQVWLQEWLKEQPGRIGLGELGVADGDPVQDEDGNPAFLAADGDDRYFSVDVLLGEMDASQGFGLLHNWARNRVRHPDKTHIAVLVTEDIGDRYRSTLEALAEHLPLVVVELNAWHGEAEAILVPRVVLKGDDVELGSVPVVEAAAASAEVEVEDETEAQAQDEAQAEADATTEPWSAVGTEETAVEPGPEVPENKDDTGVTDPWGPPTEEPLDEASDNGATELLSKVGS